MSCSKTCGDTGCRSGRPRRKPHLTHVHSSFIPIDRQFGSNAQFVVGEEVTRTVEPDLYAVLGVAPSATAGAITSAFRRRAWELRPDTRVDAVTAARFDEVRTAYETLRDPVRRAVYDRAYERSSRHRHRHRAPSDAAAAASPLSRLRYLFVPGGAAPEPPLRAGPVRWEPPGERP